MAETPPAEFRLADDGVDPNQVPRRTLYTGAAIPAVGLGTFGSDRFGGEAIAEAVLGAAAVGYRHFDCASIYRNEAEIGESFRTILDSGLVPRGDLWITSKLWNDKHGEGEVLPACKQSLANLRCTVTEPLTDGEMEAIAGIDRDCRLIKGHVFLWKDGQSWEDLWDPDGVITPA